LWQGFLHLILALKKEIGNGQKSQESKLCPGIAIVESLGIFGLSGKTLGFVGIH
jgi:hypothetical protein